MSEDHICRKCGCGISIPDDLDDTGFCNLCAQSIASAAEAFVLAHKGRQDIDLDFLFLCEAVLPIKEHYNPETK